MVCGYIEVMDVWDVRGRGRYGGGGRLWESETVEAERSEGLSKIEKLLSFDWMHFWK